MGENIPKIRPRDEELARIQDNLANALQGVLDDQSASQGKATVLAPQMTQPRGPGTAYVVKVPALQISGRPDGPFQVNQPTITFGNPQDSSTPGRTIPQRDAELFSWGQIVLFGSRVQQDGVVIIPQVQGPAFRVAPDNRYTCFQINYDGSAGCTGAFNAASVRSDAGFKSWLPPLQYTNGKFPGGLQPLCIAITPAFNSAAYPLYWSMTMPRSGSVTAITVTHYGTSQLVCAVTINKNGPQVYSANITNNTGNGYVTIPKGSVPFVAGDTLTSFITYSIANVNVQTVVAIEIEEGA